MSTPRLRVLPLTQVDAALAKRWRDLSDGAVEALEAQVVAPAGSFIVLDGMVFHSGSVNRTSAARRAVNHVYTLPFIKQQIELPALLGDKYRDDPMLRRLLDYDNEPARSVAAYYESRMGRRRAH